LDKLNVIEVTKTNLKKATLCNIMILRGKMMFSRRFIFSKYNTAGYPKKYFQKGVDNANNR